MANISKASVRKIINNSSDIMITEKALEAISAILEREAKKIASYAVGQAKRHGRKSILKEDVEKYSIKYGD
jgi:histone H3/H4